MSYTEFGFEDFSFGLINSRILLEGTGAGGLLNEAFTAERISMRLFFNLQTSFAKLTFWGFDMEVPFGHFIEYIEQEHRLLCCHFGR